MVYFLEWFPFEHLTVRVLYAITKLAFFVYVINMDTHIHKYRDSISHVQNSDILYKCNYCILPKYILSTITLKEEEIS